MATTTTKYLDDTRSLEVLESLTKGLNFEVPDVDFDDASLQVPKDLLLALQKAPTTITRESITDIDQQLYKSSGSHTIEGTGSFDIFMDAYAKHLEREFKEKRIQGAEYASVYTQLISKAMDQAIQFELSKEQSYWQGITSQLAAIQGAWAVYKAKVELAIAKAQALTSKAQYANTVAQLGILDANYGNTLAQHDQITSETAHVKAQTGQVDYQNKQITAQTELTNAQTTQVPIQSAQIQAQTKLVTAQTGQVDHQNKQIDAQTGLVTAQTGQVAHQNDQIDAQTAKTREEINYVIKQEALVVQQTTSTKRRDEYNAIKLQSDAYTIQKSIDEGTIAPNLFTNGKIDEKLGNHFNNLGI